MPKRLITLILLVSLSSAYAQQRIVVNSFGGFVIAHRTVMQNLVTGHTRGGEVAFEHTFRGTKSWHSVYRYPTAGLSILGLDLGNPVQLGTAFGLTPYFRLPVGAKNDHFSFKFGLGFGYLTKHFSQYENHKNVAIGSGVNASIVLGLWYKVKLSQNAALQTGIQMQHFSNGAFRTPNLGVNLPMIGLGIQFGKQERVPLSEVETIKEDSLDLQTSFYVSPRFGLKELITTGDKKYPTYGMHISRIKPLSYKYSFTLFMDFLYNSSLKQELVDREIYLRKTSDYAQLGAGAGFCRAEEEGGRDGRFAVYLQMAAYLYSKQPEVGRFYHRLGVKHIIGRRNYVSFGLKSHFAKADYLELGCGIKL